MKEPAMLARLSSCPAIQPPVTADCAVPAHLGTAVERLALTLLNLAEAFEVEAGLTVHITPALAPEELAALAGGTARTVALLLEQLCKDGVVFQRRRRLVLSNPAALHMLALGQVPELAS